MRHMLAVCHIRYFIPKCLKFFRSPKVYFFYKVFPYGSSLAAWVIFQVIIADGIIHNVRKMVIYRAGVCCGTWVSLTVTVGNQAVLPFADMRRNYFWYFHLPEEWEQILVDHYYFWIKVCSRSMCFIFSLYIVTKFSKFLERLACCVSRKFCSHSLASLCSLSRVSFPVFLFWCNRCSRIYRTMLWLICHNMTA